MNEILSISTSKNDGDIVEAFIRSNSKYVDFFVILDDSTDNTVEIICKLQSEGYQIKVVSRHGNPASQVEVMNKALADYADPNKYCLALLLDLDEVVLAKSKNELINLGDATSPIAMLWTPFIPNGRDYLGSQDPLRSCFFSSPKIYSPVQKVAVPRKLFSEIVMPGNHGLKSKLFPHELIPVFLSDIRIGHFPVRFSGQIITKIITALATINIKKNRLPGEASHLTPIMQLIRDSKFNLDKKVLQLIAKNYGAELLAPPSFGLLVKNYLRDVIGSSRRARLLPNIEIKYLDLARINYIQLLDEIIEVENKFTIEKMKIIDNDFISIVNEAKQSIQ